MEVLGMEEPPGRVIGRIGRIVEETVDEAVQDHERRCHAIPPANNAPLEAIPFADIVLSDDELSHAIEMLREYDEDTVAARLDIPLPALQRTLADFRRRYGRFLYQRATTG
jgi:hypothetical protein